MNSSEPTPSIASDVSPVSRGRLETLLYRYARYASGYSNTRFIIEMFALSFVLKIICAAPLVALGGTLTEGPSNTEQMAGEMGVAGLVISSLVIAPPLETLLFQWFLIWITSRFTGKISWKIGIPSALFALSHAPYGIGMIPATFFPGIIFGLAFVVKRAESRWRAFWVTSVIHTAHNAVAMVAFAFSL